MKAPASNGLRALSFEPFRASKPPADADRALSQGENINKKLMSRKKRSHRLKALVARSRALAI
jgi:hypothetical protein